MKLLSIFSLAIFSIASQAVSQAVFDVMALEGNAKMQRMQQKEWKDLSIGSQLHDNDIVETFFQTRLVLQFGKGNVAILGSNSKALVNIREQKTEKGLPNLELNLTLFSGGLFVKAIEDCHVSVYTSNAVGETDKGGFSTFVESKSGETGVQVLGGDVKARNIAQKEGIGMSSGQTTVIFPGKEPTAPLYISVRHVSVLKHFFGDEYIEMELSAAGIKPTDQLSTAAVPSSQDMQAARSQDQGMSKTTFSLNKIYGAILADQDKQSIHQTALTKPRLYLDDRIMLEENNSFAMAHGASFPCFSLTASYSAGIFSAGIRLPMASNFTGKTSFYASSTAGLLDKIDHVTVGRISDSLFIHFGAIEDYTIGNGLVVNEFNNANPYSLYRPLGFTTQFQWHDLTLRGFVADVSSFSIGGIHLMLGAGNHYFGIGYFFDANQTQTIADTNAYRFVNLNKPDSSTVYLGSNVKNANIYEFDVGTDVFNTYSMQVTLGAEFAQKLAQWHADGFALRAPVIALTMPSMNFKAAVVSETGRLIAGQFHSFYMSNRYRLIDTMHLHDTLFTQNTMLSPNRESIKLELSFSMIPYKGTLLDAFFSPDVFEHHTTVLDTSYSSLNLSFGLSATINDGLLPAVRYASIFFRSTHMGLFPPRFTFPSWGFLFGIDVISNPLFLGIGLTAGFSMYTLDMNADNVVDPTDNVVEFRIGLRRGF